MVNEANGRLFRRKDGKYLVYIPVYLATDSQFPFKGDKSVKVRVSFNPAVEPKTLLIQEVKPT